MEQVIVASAFGLAALAFIPAFWAYSPASRSAKVWTTLWFTIAAAYLFLPDIAHALIASTRSFVAEKPLQAAITAVSIGVPLKYLQQKLRYARLNSIKWRFGFTDDRKTWENITIEQAQEIERNMAETSTDPGVSRAIGASGHFINEDKRVEHQRMQATVHLMTGLPTYTVKSRFSSLVIARINEHHHRYGIKINSDDVLYLMIHFGLAPVPWINKFGYRKMEEFEVHAIWVLWRELACRMGVKYIPESLEQAQQWRKNFETTMRWREDPNEIMADAMLSQVLYPVPRILRGFVAKVFVSLVDWDIVYFCKMEKYGPSPVLRAVVYDLFQFCGFCIREFGLPRLSPYVRSPPKASKEGKMVFPHTPYDTMPYWQERSFWSLWGPRGIWNRIILGLPTPSKEFQSDGVPFEQMGAPHPHAGTQSNIEKKVRDNATTLEEAPYGYRPAIGFQIRRLIPPVDGPEYGMDMNRFPKGTPTTPATPVRFTREYERRGGGFEDLTTLEKPADVEVRVDEAISLLPKINEAAAPTQGPTLVSAAA